MCSFGKLQTHRELEFNDENMSLYRNHRASSLLQYMWVSASVILMIALFQLMFLSTQNSIHPSIHASIDNDSGQQPSLSSYHLLSHQSIRPATLPASIHLVIQLYIIHPALFMHSVPHLPIYYSSNHASAIQIFFFYLQYTSLYSHQTYAIHPSMIFHM